MLALELFLFLSKNTVHVLFVQLKIIFFQGKMEYFQTILEEENTRAPLSDGDAPPGPWSSSRKPPRQMALSGCWRK